MTRVRAPKHHPPQVWLAIASAGGVGSLLRYLITAGGGWGPIVVANALGCAVLGVLVARGRATPALAVGFCGGLTTFSGVAAQASGLARGDHLAMAGTDLSGAAAHGLVAGLLLLAFNAAVGLAAFTLARRTGGVPGAGAAPAPAPRDATP
jgi:fluoride ion exporter CrcB/FEX